MIRIELDDKELNRALDSLAARVANMTPLMHRIAQVMDEGVREHFARETGPDGHKWAPLATSTLLGGMRRASPGGLRTRRGNTRAKAVKALSQKKILLDTGRLSHDLGREVSSMSARLTSVQPYSGVHQFGAPRRNIPARPFMGFSDAMVESIKETVTDYIALALGGG